MRILLVVLLVMGSVLSGCKGGPRESHQAPASTPAGAEISEAVFMELNNMLVNFYTHYLVEGTYPHHVLEYSGGYALRYMMKLDLIFEGNTHPAASNRKACALFRQLKHVYTNLDTDRSLLKADKKSTDSNKEVARLVNELRREIARQYVGRG